MAWDPCVSCGRDFHGATSFTYVTWHVGEQRFAFRLRECLACATDRRNGVMGVADVRREDETWAPVQERREQPESSPKRNGSRR